MSGNALRPGRGTLQTARQGAEILGATTPAGARLIEMSRYLDYVGRQMTLVVEDWRRS
jgi:hypothetical protein